MVLLVGLQWASSFFVQIHRRAAAEAGGGISRDGAERQQLRN